MASAPQQGLPLLYNDLTPISSQVHGEWRFREVRGAKFLQGVHAVPVLAEEFIAGEPLLSDRLLAGLRSRAAGADGAQRRRQHHRQRRGPVPRRLLHPGLCPPLSVPARQAAAGRRRAVALRRSDVRGRSARSRMASRCSTMARRASGPSRSSASASRWSRPAASPRRSSARSPIRSCSPTASSARSPMARRSPSSIAGSRSSRRTRSRICGATSRASGSRAGCSPLIYAHLFSLQRLTDVFGRQMTQGKMPLPDGALLS